MSRNSAGRSSQSHFAQLPSANIQRSTFDRTSGHKTTFDSGLLIPFFVDEILPGDTVSLSTSILARLATPIFPYMDNVFLDVHYFFVPNRLVWENWERFNGAQDDPDSSTDFLLPQLSATTHSAGFGELSIYDYMGLPTKIASIVQNDMPQSLPFRAYYLIYNDWYRDENLQDSLEFSKGDGPDTTAFTLQRRGRRKDYFTSALPWPQKGPAVSLPIVGTAPVTTNASNATPISVYRTTSSSYSTLDADQLTVETGAGAGLEANRLYVDFAEATAASINEMREAITLQQLFERDARGGTRYVEILLSHFGVVSPDFRLQRPEYLGGGTTPLNVNPIAQTSETDGSPQGNLAAFATASGSHGFNHSFVEHGHLIGIFSVRADTTYQQGLNKMWSRRTRYDFYWPTLANLGEQVVANKEIYMAASEVQNNAAYGYQERFAEYRYRPSIVTGRFRSNATAPLDAWHLALDFDSLPDLASMVEEDPPIDRIISVPTEPQFIADTYTKMRHTRPMPTYSIPGLSKL